MIDGDMVRGADVQRFTSKQRFTCSVNSTHNKRSGVIAVFLE